MAIKQPHPIRVAIDGVDAAGKTSLANELSQPLRKRHRPVIRASLDGFHHPRRIRHQRGSTSPEGYYYDTFDYEAVKTLLLTPLGPDGNWQYQTAVFDFDTDVSILSPVCSAHPHSILLFDGVFLLCPELYHYWDYKIFVEVEFTVAVERAATRDQVRFGSAEAVQARYWQRYVPGQRLYLQSCQPGERADLIVDNNDPMNPKIYIPQP
ncbi:MAG: uridine kinase [Anaerolineae bacterium]|nr:uridine kinase [Anaerolineae bacterium]